MWLPTRRQTVASSFIFLFLFITLEWVPWLIQDHLRINGGRQAGIWIFWLQTLAGNWSPTSPVVSPWLSAFSAVLAIFLNNAPVLAVIGLIWRLVHIRKREMKLGQAFTSRDQMNKQALYQSIGHHNPEIIKKIDESFVQGKKAWRRHLIAVFGETETAKLLEMLNESI